MRKGKSAAAVQPGFEIAEVTRFATVIEGAAVVLNTALAGQARAIEIPAIAAAASSEPWTNRLMRQSSQRLQHILRTLNAYPAEAPADAAGQAFGLLSTLTRAETDLKLLRQHDPAEALRSLDVILSTVGQDLALRSTLAAKTALLRPEASFDTVAADILDQAGGGYTLTEAADKLAMSRQALHKRLTGETALGMMLGSQITLPKLQFTTTTPAKILPGIAAVVKTFSSAKAGKWAALQFLIEPDPNLEAAPIEALRAGRIDAVTHAARAMLHLDEA